MYAFFSDLVEFLNLELPRFYYLNEDERKYFVKMNKRSFKRKISIFRFYNYYYLLSLPKKNERYYVSRNEDYKQFKQHIKELKSFMKNNYGLILNFY